MLGLLALALAFVVSHAAVVINRPSTTYFAGSFHSEINPGNSIYEADLSCVGEDCNHELKSCNIKAIVDNNVPHMQIVITPENSTRWQLPPTNRNPAALKSTDDVFPLGISITKAPEEMRIAVFQSVDGEDEPLNHFSLSNLVYRDRWLQLTAFLNSTDTGMAFIYGWGGRSGMMKLDSSVGMGYSMYNGDRFGAAVGKNTYASHPFVLVKDVNGWYGIYLATSNEADLVFETGGRMTFRLGGGIFDVHVFSSSSARGVVQLYHQFIGLPAMPPLWALGYHQSRYGYLNYTEPLAEALGHVAIDVPLDVLWLDIDYMDGYKDFTFDPVNFPLSKMQDFSNVLRRQGQRLVFILDPVIKINSTYATYNRAMELDIFLKTDKFRTRDTVIKGWPELGKIPDFTHPKAYQFWFEQIATLKNQVQVDGLWLDMNEPASFCDGNYDIKESMNLVDEFPWYCPVQRYPELVRLANLEPEYELAEQDHVVSLNHRSASTNATFYDGSRMYERHNQYGNLQAAATYDALLAQTGERPFVLSRDTFPGAGQFAASWTGDEVSTWEVMRTTVQTVLANNMFGIPLFGSDIGALQDNTDHTVIPLLTRWVALGSLYPFSRNHHHYVVTPGKPRTDNSILAQPAETQAIMREFIRGRYRLLPYLYTIMFTIHKEGGGVWEPMFFHFDDLVSYKVPDQFMIGSSLLASPVLEENDDAKVTYFPPQVRWYHYYTGKLIINSPTNMNLIVVACGLADPVPLFIRGGSIIPTQVYGLTVSEANQTPLVLLVALSGKITGEPFNSATGLLYSDDEISINATDDGQHTRVQYSALVLDTPGNSTLFSLSSILLSTENRPNPRLVGTVNIFGWHYSSDVSCAVDGRKVGVVVDTTTDVLSVSLSLVNMASEWTLRCAAPHPLSPSTTARPSHSPTTAPSSASSIFIPAAIGFAGVAVVGLLVLGLAMSSSFRQSVSGCFSRRAPLASEGYRAVPN